VYQTQNNNELLQIPAGNSTGSLPDLTQVHFQQSPISNSIDPQDQLITVTSSFTTVSLPVNSLPHNRLFQSLMFRILRSQWRAQINYRV
jgi:Transducer of regulated CREB activity middle domain